MDRFRIAGVLVVYGPEAKEHGFAVISEDEDLRGELDLAGMVLFDGAELKETESFEVEGSRC